MLRTILIITLITSTFCLQPPAVLAGNKGKKRPVFNNAAKKRGDKTGAAGKSLNNQKPVFETRTKKKPNGPKP